MRILIIEDDHKISNALKRGLEQESYAVDTVYSGTDGLDYAVSSEYDLILLDLMLPGINGIEVCNKLRDKGIHTPILMLTAKSELDDKVKGLNTGADDYVTKPFAFEELLARIKALLRRPKEALENVITCGNLKMDTVNFKVTRGSTEIELSKREYGLLEYLIRNKGKILTKDQIIAHVWDYDSEVIPNTVEQFIAYLRNKIDRPFKKDKPLIKTIRGFGYKISEE